MVEKIGGCLIAGAKSQKLLAVSPSQFFRGRIFDDLLYGGEESGWLNRFLAAAGVCLAEFFNALLNAWVSVRRRNWSRAASSCHFSKSPVVPRTSITPLDVWTE